ncbi:unnamed protein product [Meganyctiphanes norvegica]|uniref:Uncharacterized protein n=1 Tax=Meganyctiphanes norvegica TaxID=48144 RepID=A0AAV2QHQ3_MEGNR
MMTCRSPHPPAQPTSVSHQPLSSQPHSKDTLLMITYQLHPSPPYHLVPLELGMSSHFLQRAQHPPRKSYYTTSTEAAPSSGGVGVLVYFKSFQCHSSVI